MPSVYPQASFTQPLPSRDAPIPTPPAPPPPHGPFSALLFFKKRIAPLLITIVLFAGLGVSVYLVKQSTDQKSIAVSGGANLWLNPKDWSLSATPGDTFSLSVIIAPNQQQVTAADFIVTFDTNLFTLRDINILENNNLSAPLIPLTQNRIVLGIRCTATGCPAQTSTATIATLLFVLNPGVYPTTSTISFDSSVTALSAINQANNVIGNLTGSTITLTPYANPSDTPSLTPTANPSPPDPTRGSTPTPENSPLPPQNAPRKEKSMRPWQLHATHLSLIDKIPSLFI